MKNSTSESGRLRTIETARNLDEINRAVENGFFPLVKHLKPSDELRSTYCVFRHRRTNKVEVADAEEGYRQYNEHYQYHPDEWEMVIGYARHYPYDFPSPFAAYLIPPDLAIGERVIIADLIEDYYGGQFWGRHIRLESLEAIWDGRDLIVQYRPDVDGVCNLIG